MLSMLSMLSMCQRSGSGHALPDIVRDLNGLVLTAQTQETQETQETWETRNQLEDTKIDLEWTRMNMKLTSFKENVFKKSHKQTISTQLFLSLNATNCETSADCIGALTSLFSLARICNRYSYRVGKEYGQNGFCRATCSNNFNHVQPLGIASISNFEIPSKSSKTRAGGAKVGAAAAPAAPAAPAPFKSSRCKQVQTGANRCKLPRISQDQDEQDPARSSKVEDPRCKCCKFCF